MQLSSLPVPERLGRYEIREVIGHGSMGVVLLAKDPVIDRQVAIKMIQISLTLDPQEQAQYRERFAREAKAAGSLMHPGIVTLFDVGESEEGVPFLVMEYVSGLTLRETLRGGAMDPEEAIPLTIEILDALFFAHTRGVIHRDIKPSNILITPDRHVKIMDFGIAHVIGSNLTGTNEFLGTPYFMAPEQVTKQQIDQRTDLFSVGVVFYEMLTGRKPFTGETLASLTYSILHEQAVPPHRLRSEISPALSRIVLRCLMKDPGLRYGTALEMKGELAAAQRKHIPDFVEDFETATEGDLTAPYGHKRVFRIAAAVILMLALLALLPVLFFGKHETQETSPAPAPSSAVGGVPPRPENQPSEVQQPEVIHEELQIAEPLSARVEHRHLFGSCKGTLTFAEEGVEFSSSVHIWHWKWQGIRKLERPEMGQIRVTSYEKGTFGNYKNYNFFLQGSSLSGEEWTTIRNSWRKSR